MRAFARMPRAVAGLALNVLVARARTAKDKENSVVERYTASARWFHWLYVVVFLWLVLSGLLLFWGWFGLTPVGNILRIMHRVGAVLLVGAPVVFAIFNRDRAWYFIKEAFMWGKADLGWLKAAPRYYFGGDERMMPPQGYINTGMKLYRLAILFGGALFIITGIILWFFKGIVPPVVFQWCLMAHDITFISSICMLFLHIQLGVFHPRMDESLLSIVDGKVSGVYAKSHHGLWYGKIAEKENKDKDTVVSPGSG
jgi:formate dehydrogenase subunit gamma